LWANEIDPFPAQWQRNLMAEGLIPAAEVDERSILDVTPAQLAGYRQCHFFAGISVWPLALRIAGFPEDREVWTGSCPCQPFSAAGKGKGAADERHLWPAWHWLIEQCRPELVLGEQVASADGLAWLDLVASDLEGTGYTLGVVDTCAAGFGAPHIRQRLYWMAYANDARPQGRRIGGNGTAERAVGPRGVAGGLVDANGGDACAEGLQRGREHGREPQDGGAPRGGDRGARAETAGYVDRTGPTNGLWRDADWLACRDGKWRPVEPGTFPLAHGVAGRVGRLRAYGNALCVTQVAEFVAAVMEVI
jgi:DNA (cytosine-5)-methyltransferase 1